MKPTNGRWRLETCEFCGLRYRNFRPKLVTFTDGIGAARKMINEEIAAGTAKSLKR